MSQLANISVLETLQNSANTQMGVGSMSVFNATFSGESNVKPEQKAAYQKVKDAIEDAEADFRKKDDVFLKKEKEIAKVIAAEKAKLQKVQVERHAAATKFDSGKIKLDTPLKDFGVRVTWIEPQTDAAHIDVEV